MWQLFSGSPHNLENFGEKNPKNPYWICRPIFGLSSDKISKKKTTLKLPVAFRKFLIERQLRKKLKSIIK
jgi:hypothetical protein